MLGFQEHGHSCSWITWSSRLGLVENSQLKVWAIWQLCVIQQRCIIESDPLGDALSGHHDTTAREWLTTFWKLWSKETAKCLRGENKRVCQSRAPSTSSKAIISWVCVLPWHCRFHHVQRCNHCHEALCRIRAIKLNTAWPMNDGKMEYFWTQFRFQNQFIARARHVFSKRCLAYQFIKFHWVSHTQENSTSFVALPPC